MSNQSLTDRLSRQCVELSEYRVPEIPLAERSDAMREYGRCSAGLIIAVGYEHRLPTAIRNLRQLVEEGHASDSPVRISSIVAVNFKLNEHQIAPLGELLSELRGRGLVDTCEIVACEPHSAARSFNVGVRQMQQLSGLPDYVVKIDDDARHGHGTFNDVIRSVIDRDLHLASPVYYRPGKPLDFSDDSAFAGVTKEAGYQMRWPHGLRERDWVGIPNYVTSDSSGIDLGRLMLGFDTSWAESPTSVTPCESGLVLSRDLIEALTASNSSQETFPEGGVGSEGLRLLTAISRSGFSERCGVAKTAVFDRPMEGGQPRSWGESDALLVRSLRDIGLMPPGILATGVNDAGTIYSFRMSSERPCIIRGIERLELLYQALRRNSRGVQRVHTIDEQTRHGLISQIDEVRSEMQKLPRQGYEEWGRYRADHPGLKYDDRYVDGTLEYLAGAYHEFRRHGMPLMIM